MECANDNNDAIVGRNRFIVFYFIRLAILYYVKKKSFLEALPGCSHSDNSNK